MNKHFVLLARKMWSIENENIGLTEDDISNLND